MVYCKPHREKGSITSFWMVCTILQNCLFFPSLGDDQGIWGVYTVQEKKGGMYRTQVNHSFVIFTRKTHVGHEGFLSSSLSLAYGMGAVQNQASFPSSQEQ